VYGVSEIDAGNAGSEFSDAAARAGTFSGERRLPLLVHFSDLAPWSAAADY
jgi:hypothetical protein